MQVAVVDDDDELLPDTQIGEIVVRPQRPGVLFSGYYGRDDLTVARSGNLWFHSGDLGWFDVDGFLHFVGRKDHRIRRGGENIDPNDVEETLLHHPALREAAVVGVSDEVMGQEVKAVLVIDVPLDPTELADFLGDRLPRFAWPRFVEVRESIPKTSTQKIAYTELGHAVGEVVDLRLRNRIELRPAVSDSSTNGAGE